MKKDAEPFTLRRQAYWSLSFGSLAFFLSASLSDFAPFLVLALVLVPDLVSAFFFLSASSSFFSGVGS